MIVFCIGPALGGVAGMMVGIYYGQINFTMGWIYGLKAFTAAILGGIGNIRGSIISATLLTILPELLRAFANYRMLIYAIVLSVVMLATINPTLYAQLKLMNPRGEWRSEDADEA